MLQDDRDERLEMRGSREQELDEQIKSADFLVHKNVVLNRNHQWLSKRKDNFKLTLLYYRV